MRIRVTVDNHATSSIADNRSVLNHHRPERLIAIKRRLPLHAAGFRHEKLYPILSLNGEGG